MITAAAPAGRRPPMGRGFGTGPRELTHTL
jgi:hypothetical protein